MISWEESGRLTSELSIKNGKRSGVVLEWYPDGSKKTEAVYEDDELVGRNRWDANGEVLEE